MMDYCKNHIDRKTFYKCATCNSYICYTCLQEYLLPIRNKKIGFCSKECFSRYKILQQSNRKKSLKYLWISVIAFIIGLLDVIFYLDKIVLGFSNYSIKEPKTAVLVCSIGLFFINFGKFYDLYFLGQNSVIYDPFSEENSGKKNVKHQINKVDRLNITELNKEQRDSIIKSLKQNPLFYITTGINSIENVISKIREFGELFLFEGSGMKTETKIFIGSTSDSYIQIFFEQTMPEYYFINLLSIMEPLNAVGYMNIKGKVYLLKTPKASGDYLIGVNENKENIEVSLVDGGYKYSNKKYLHFTEDRPRYNDLLRIVQVKINIDKSNSFDKLFSAYA